MGHWEWGLGNGALGMGPWELEPITNNNQPITNNNQPMTND